MKIILSFLICVLYIWSNTVSAQEGAASGEAPGVVNNRDRQIQRPVSPPRPRRPERRDVPSGAVTPDQIKSFLSKPQEENYIILNFDNADLKDVISTVASITNENFIITPGVDARITIHSSKKIPVSEVMSVFESVLEVNGMTLVRSGEFFKIVSGAAAKQKPIPVRKGSEMDGIPEVDRLVTQIVPVQYVPVSEVSQILTPLLSQFGSITPNPRNNLLIISDLSSNIIRHLQILKEVDVNAFKNTRMFFFKPKYSDVLTISSELTEVLTALNLAGEGLVLLPIERINSLVVFSASPTLLQTVEGWIKRLDEEVVTGQNVFVYPVQNVKASDIAEILKTLYEDTTSTKPRVVGQKKQPAATKTTRTTRTTPRRRTQQQTESASRVEIITFEPTNSLVILAPPGIYREMVQTIKRIDTYPREVLIEAVIAKVDISDSDQFGIRWSVLHRITEGKGSEDWRAVVHGNTTETLPLLDAPDFLSGPTGGLAYLIFRPDRLSAMIYALAAESKVNILQSPRLLVRDQEEASIEVGSEIPTATSTTSTTTTDTLTQSIQYRTVGIKLKIKPTISEEKTVVLDLEQEVSALGGDQQVGQTGNTFPVFNSTTTKTSIVVPDKQGIVIGGIMEESINKGWSGIPVLGSIPVLGHLFRYTEDIITKSELIIIITPHVLTDRDEGEVITQEFMSKLSEIKSYLDEREEEDSEPSSEK
jgi:general secretion pathway protein D